MRVGEGGKPRPAAQLTVTTEGTTIKMEPAHKFLGVVLDQELRFREHAAYAHGKGMAVAAQTKRLVKVNGGVHGSMVQRLYEVVVAPNMLYALDVWCKPDIEVDGRRVKGNRGFAAKMGRVQRMCALQVTAAHNPKQFAQCPRRA